MEHEIENLVQLSMDEVDNAEMDEYILSMARELYEYDDVMFDFFNTVEEAQNV